MSPPTCPCCRSPGAVQRVAALASSGAQQVRVIGDDGASMDSVVRIRLAELLAPPRRPGGGGCLALALLCGLLIASLPVSLLATIVIVQLQGTGVEDALASGMAERVFALIAGLAALTGIALFGLIARLQERDRRADAERWEQQMARWRRTWYCHRCHAAFVAGTSRAVAPEQIGQLLA